MVVISQNKKWATIEYTIKNHGEMGAPLLGKTGSLNDNIALKAYISGVGKLTSGAIPVGGDYIHNQPKGEAGILPAGKRYKQTFKLDIRQRTQYMNHFIFVIDSYQTVKECDEKNNIFVLKLEEPK